MNIRNMSGAQCAETMGECVTEMEGERMRALLLAAGYLDTCDVGEGDWDDLCARAVRDAQEGAA